MKNSKRSASAFETLGTIARRLSGLTLAALTATLLVACGGGGNGEGPQVATILTQPADQSVIEGNAATFSVAADGAVPLSYQWADSPDGLTFTAISGATSASYSIGATTLGQNARRYHSGRDGFYGGRRSGRSRNPPRREWKAVLPASSRHDR